MQEDGGELRVGWEVGGDGADGTRVVGGLVVGAGFGLRHGVELAGGQVAGGDDGGVVGGGGGVVLPIGVDCGVDLVDGEGFLRRFGGDGLGQGEFFEGAGVVAFGEVAFGGLQGAGDGGAEAVREGGSGEEEAGEGWGDETPGGSGSFRRMGQRPQYVKVFLLLFFQKKQRFSGMARLWPGRQGVEAG